jgi:two-component system sensor histidine kinase RegB
MIQTRLPASGTPLTGAPAPHLRLGTLVTMRWLALIGQTIALAVVYFGLDLDLPLIPAMAVVMLSGALNVAISVARPSASWLGERQAAAMLAFDLVQIAVLLGLTGGLGNPFTLFLVVPVAVAAWALGRRYAFAVAGLALALVTGLAFVFLPLPGGAGMLTASLPFFFAIWAALAVAIGFLAVYGIMTARQAGDMSKAYAAMQLALAREQKAAALGALAAAAAHELGSPLSTIAVVAGELERRFHGDETLYGDESLREDLALLKSESARCQTILSSIAARPAEAEGRREAVPLTAVIEEAARPYAGDGVHMEIRALPLEERGEQPPLVEPSAGLVQGLAMLIQNAVQFAGHGVVLTLDWENATIKLLVEDDGPGFDMASSARLGEPFYTTGARARGEGERHMGLGLFIARTLLAASGAHLAFDNRAGGGAVVEVVWPQGLGAAMVGPPQVEAIR